MLSKIRCWIFGHDLEVWQSFSRTSRRVVCNCCGGDWGMSDHARAMIPWCGELAELYESMGHKIRPRTGLRR